MLFYDAVSTADIMWVQMKHGRVLKRGITCRIELSSSLNQYGGIFSKDSEKPREISASDSVCGANR